LILLNVGLACLIDPGLRPPLARLRAGAAARQKEQAMQRAKSSIATWGTLALGVVLLVSPWIFGFANVPEETGNSMIAGGLIAVTSLLAIYTQRLWPEGWIDFVLLNIVFGMGVMVTPGLFHFGVVAGWISVLLGLGVVVLSIVEAWRTTGPVLGAT
jgi:SPW repeat